MVVQWQELKIFFNNYKRKFATAKILCPRKKKNISINKKVYMLNAKNISGRLIVLYTLSNTLQIITQIDLELAEVH